MSHAFTAISSGMAMAYVTIPVTGEGGYQFGMAAMAILSGIAAVVCANFKL